MSLTQPKKIRRVYLDYAAATPVDPRVLAAMRPYLGPEFANPSALYASAVEARKAIEEARKTVAEALFTQPDTIIFTSGGTESCNLALLGAAHQHGNTPTQQHIITTEIEHKAVLEPIRELERQGARVTYLAVDKDGKIDLNEFKKVLRKETMLVSIQYANNEIGTIQPIAEIGREILKWRKQTPSSSPFVGGRNYRGRRNTPLLTKEGAGEVEYPYFHTDACQAGAYLDLNVEKLHVDLMSLNSGKIYGPKGIGVLYKRRRVAIKPLMYGGGQEMGLRPGTENVAGIVGFAHAIAECRMQNEELRRIGKLRDYFWRELKEKIDYLKLNGPAINYPSPGRGGRGRGYKAGNETRLPNNLNMTLPGLDAEALILYLDAIGIECSSQSACATDSDEVSHVLLAIGKSEAEARASVRFTLGRQTTKKDIDYVLKYLPPLVRELRRVRELN